MINNGEINFICVCVCENDSFPCTVSQGKHAAGPQPGEGQRELVWLWSPTATGAFVFQPRTLQSHITMNHEI